MIAKPRLKLKPAYREQTWVVRELWEADTIRLDTFSLYLCCKIWNQNLKPGPVVPLAMFLTPPKKVPDISNNVNGSKCTWLLGCQREKVVSEEARCNSELAVRPSTFMSPTNANYLLPTNAQMQTTFSNKCKLASHANLLESKWTSRQCNSEAFCHFNGIKICLISASQMDRLDPSISFSVKRSRSWYYVVHVVDSGRTCDSDNLEKQSLAFKHYTLGVFYTFVIFLNWTERPEISLWPLKFWVFWLLSTWCWYLIVRFYWGIQTELREKLREN